MCKIIILFLSAVQVFGATSKVGTSFQVKETKLEVKDSEPNASSSFQANRIFGSVTGLGTYWDLDTFFNTERVDYSKTSIQNSEGTEVSLGSGYELQNQVGLGVNFGADPWQAGINLETYVSRHPFDRRSISGNFSRSFYNKSTIVGGAVSFLEESRPESYFFNKHRVLERRPDETHTLGVSVKVEQVVSERIKTFLELGTSKNREERPRNYSVSWMNRIALTDRVFASLDSYFIREDKDQIIRNERGYMTAAYQRVGLTFEPVFDLLVSGSYSLGIEQENLTYMETRNFIGSDQYGLGLKYIHPKMELDFTAAYMDASNNQETLTGVMSFTWLI